MRKSLSGEEVELNTLLLKYFQYNIETIFPNEFLSACLNCILFFI